MSAVNIIDQIDKERYELLLIGITKEGRWLRAESAEEIRSGEWRSSREQAVILPDAVRKSALVSGNGESREFPLDVVFPVLHGSVSYTHLIRPKFLCGSSVALLWF